MAAESGNRWPGGRIHQQADGRKLFIIERRVRGKRFHVSTRAHSLTAAMKQLERFEADPLGYAPEGDEPAVALLLTNDLVLEHEEWSKQQKSNTPKYARATRRRLADWIDDLGRTDLRKVTTARLKELLAERTGQKARIIALKSFFAWLRTEKGLLHKSQDPTLDLLVPQGRPEKHVRRKAVARASVVKVLGLLSGAYRDCIFFLANTGWHVTELERLVRGQGELLELGPAQQATTGALAVALVRHKTGRTTRTPVRSKELLEVARRLVARKEVPRHLNAELAAACVTAEVDAFGAGVLRHSFATWAVEAGADPREVALALDHQSESTTQRFYIDIGVPSSKLPVFDWS